MSETGEVHPVSSRAWVEVLHAEVGTRLGAAGVPCLHIKGPTVATWLYEFGERSWGDVDILVPPHRMDDALEVLLASGFSYRHPGVHWWTSEDHALTLWHDPRGDARHKLTAEVDVHHRFLGIDADPERAFAELWRRREPARLAELDVWFPDLTSRALIVVLNAARDPDGDKAPTDLRRLLAATPDDQWRRTIALARRIDALEALRAGLETADTGRDLVSRTSLADVSVSAAVRLRAEGSSRTAVRLEELRTFGTLKKIRMIVGWVVPSPAVIRMREPTAAGSPWRMARAYLDRYRQGARELAGAVRAKRGQGRGSAAVVRAPFADLVSSGSSDAVGHFRPDGPPGPDALTDLAAGLRETARGPASGYLLPRAGAVAEQDGSVAILCGDAGAGTTSLLTALLARGCAYLTDETLVLDPETLEVRTDNPVPDEPLEARLLVVSQYDARRDGVQVSRLTGGEAAHVLGAACDLLDEVAGGPVRALARVARRVPGYRLSYADSELAADELLRLWRESETVARAVTAPADEVVRAVRGLVAADVSEPGEEVGSYFRPAHVGVSHDDAQIVLLDLRDGERRVLSPTAAAIWDTLMAAGTLEATVATLEEAFPDAPGLHEDTARFVAGLEAQGLLERA